MAWGGQKGWGAQSWGAQKGGGGGAWNNQQKLEPAQTVVGPAKGVLFQAAKGASKGVSAPLLASSAYIVACVGPDAQEDVVKTLVGEYTEVSENCDRKVFKKPAEPGKTTVDVWMYYWDERDGAAFKGWWFGNEVGGTQVWAHCVSDHKTPPAQGWKIPWDGQVRNSLSVRPKAGAQAVASPSFGAPAGAAPGLSMALAGAGTDTAVVAAKEALVKALAAVGEYKEPEKLAQAEESLGEQLTSLQASLKAATDTVTKNPMGAKQAQLTCTQIRTVLGQVNAELTKVKGAKLRADTLAKNNEKDAIELKTFDSTMGEADDKANLAEDSVEKAIITAELIESAGDDFEEGKQAVDVVERLVTEATKCIGDARIFINQKQAAARRLGSAGAQATAQTNLGKLQAQIQTANDKLAPLKNVRSDFMQRNAARKLVEEIMLRLAPAELHVDQADQACLMLGFDESGSAEIQERAEKAVMMANASFTVAYKFLEQKLASCTNPVVQEELKKVDERTKTSQAKLTEMKNSRKEAGERVSCVSIQKEAADKLQAVEKAYDACRAAEGPWLMGVEELSVEESLVAVKACEAAEKVANNAVNQAKMFIATKQVEAKRFAKGLGEETVAKLTEQQEALDAHIQKIDELKGKTSERKAAAVGAESENIVSNAEDLAGKVAEPAAPLDDDEKLFSLSPEEIKAAVEATVQAEKAANTALTDARKFINARQIEVKLKDKDPASAANEAVAAFQTRLATAQAEVTRCKKLSTSLESRLAAKKTVQEAVKRLVDADEKIEALSSLIDNIEQANGEALAELETAEKKNKALEKASADATTALKTAANFLALQVKRAAAGAAKEELEKVQPRVSASHERLDALVAAAKEKNVKLMAASIVQESEAKVAEADSIVKRVAELDGLLANGDEMAIEEMGAVVAELESATAAATSNVGGTKTFLAMKRLAAKRLSDTEKEATVSTITALLERVESISTELTEAKKAMVERRAKTVKREVIAIVAAVKKRVEAVDAAVAELLKDEERTPEAFKVVCDKATTASNEAHTLADTTKNLLVARQRDVKASAVDDKEDALAEIATQQEGLKVHQVALDKLKKQLSEREDKFAAARLVSEATQVVEGIEKKYDAALEKAATLTSDKMQAITATFYLQQIVEVLRKHSKAEKKTPKELFGEMGGKEGKLAEKDFVAFVSKLVSQEEHKASYFSEEQQQSAFASIIVTEGAPMTEAAFLEQFRMRFLATASVTVTDTFEVKGGKTLRKLEVGELVEASEEPMPEESAKVLRVKAKAQKDGTEGYITISGNQGTTYMTLYTSVTATRREVEEVVASVGDDALQALKFVDAKAAELKAVKDGPLAETKAELAKMRPRITKVQYNQANLKKKVALSEKRLADLLEADRKSRAEAAAKAAIANALGEVTSSVEELRAEVEKALPTADAFEGMDDPFEAMAECEKGLERALATADKTLGLIKDKLEATKGAGKGQAELRSAVMRHKTTIVSLEANCKKSVMSLRAEVKKASEAAHSACAAALRAYAKESGAGPEEVFNTMSQTTGEVSLARLQAFLAPLPNCPTSVKLEHGLARYAGGISKLVLLEMLQEYYKCVKDIVVTETFELKDSKTIRKLTLGETVEIIEGAKLEETAGISRVQCRCLMDGAVGWVSLCGNAGTPFLEKCGKPYFSCQEAEPIAGAFEATSAEVRQLVGGEVIEILEGPRREPPTEVQRVRGKAKQDGKMGWVTLKDASGASFFEKTNLYLCKQGIAMTSTCDMGEGKAVRKLDVGEALEALEEEVVDEKRSLTRLHVKAIRDGKDGWITLKGNQGTAYAEINDKLQSCTESMALETRMTTGSIAVRTLENGELFEFMDAPKTDVKEGNNRVKGRALSDGSEGWFTLTAKNMAVWSPRCKVVVSAELKDGWGPSAEAVRTLEVGEFVQALAPPERDDGTGLVLVKVSADKDGKVGFVAMKSADGKALLEPVAAAGLAKK